MFEITDKEIEKSRCMYVPLFVEFMFWSSASEPRFVYSWLLCRNYMYAHNHMHTSSQAMGVPVWLLF